MKSVQMKCRKAIPGLLLCLMLGGCIPMGTEGTPKETGAEPPDDSQSKVYQATILQLQQELQDLRAAQLLQNAAYEDRISELEELLATPSTPSSPEPEISPYSYIEVDGGVILTAYHGTETSLVIPSSLDGKSVIGIGESAFRNSALTSVVIPEGIRTVDWFAFYGSYRLTSVTLPASVSSIAYGAFELCGSSLRIICPKDSYAAQYAQSYGIPAVTASA